MKTNAKQTLADLKAQATSTDDLMRKLAQWDEYGEMPKETQQQISGGAVAPNTDVVRPVIDILFGIWFPQDPTIITPDK